MLICCSNHNNCSSPEQYYGHPYKIMNNYYTASVINIKKYQQLNQLRRTRLILDNNGILRSPLSISKSKKFTLKPMPKLIETGQKINISHLNRHYEIEPLFTVEVNIINERNGMTVNRKIFM